MAAKAKTATRGKKQGTRSARTGMMPKTAAKKKMPSRGTKRG